jgi:hypothetical protein
VRDCVEFLSRTPFYIDDNVGLFRLDVRLTNDAAVFFILFAHVAGEILAAHADRIETERHQPFPYLGRLDGASEQVCKLGHPFLRRLGRCKYAPPNVYLKARVSGFGDGRQVRKPGTKMIFAGIKNEKEVGDLWSYVSQFELFAKVGDGMRD